MDPALPYFLMVGDQASLPGQFVHLGGDQLLLSGGGQLFHHRGSKLVHHKGGQLVQPGGCLEVAKPSLKLKSTSWTISSP